MRESEHAVPEPDSPAPDAVTSDDVPSEEVPEAVSEDDVLAPEEIQQFEADLATLQRERDEWLDTTRRLQADFENYRKRVMREQTALVERASERLLEQLLPVLDNFELALRSIDEDTSETEMQAQPTGGEAKPESTSERFRKGVELVYADLVSVLEKSGLARIDALGAPFDPNEHEAVMQDEGDGEPVVGQVLRTGWKLKGRVLRPSMVKVTRR
jgi:molecular chaperone GrpE